MNISNCAPFPNHGRNRRVVVVDGRLSPGRAGDTDHFDHNEDLYFDRRGDHALMILVVEVLVHA